MHGPLNVKEQSDLVTNPFFSEFILLGRLIDQSKFM